MARRGSGGAEGQLEAAHGAPVRRGLARKQRMELRQGGEVWRRGGPVCGWHDGEVGWRRSAGSGSWRRGVRSSGGRRGRRGRGECGGREMERVDPTYRHACPAQPSGALAPSLVPSPAEAWVATRTVEDSGYSCSHFPKEVLSNELTDFFAGKQMHQPPQFSTYLQSSYETRKLRGVAAPH
ncbi:unnamed protein product [Urochloa humidicola]